MAAILLGDEPRGTSPAGAGGTTATDDARTPEPTSPSADDAVGTPTGTSPTGTTLPTTGSPTSSSAGEDPLGIGVLMTPPACDGTWIVIAGSATDPATYPEDVSGLLSAVPSAKYVLTAGQCPSLRQQTAEGNQIYAVYVGPFPDQASACATSTGIGGGAYVKQMDAAIPPERTWEC